MLTAISATIAHDHADTAVLQGIGVSSRYCSAARYRCIMQILQCCTVSVYQVDTAVLHGIGVSCRYCSAARYRCIKCFYANKNQTKHICSV